MTNIERGILYTDFYQLTMAQLYYEQGMHEQNAQFDYFFRDYPDYGAHKAGYCVHAGLESLLGWMKSARIGEQELSRLRAHKGRGGKRLFHDGFLGWLEKNGNFDGISIDAVAEGRVVHPNVPLAVVRGPFAMAQILESSLLNHLNYQTLIATKASRIREAGERNLFIDFGLRRAQWQGANAGARAALIGGADFSSNTGTSYALGYSPKGTHAHSLVQAFMALGYGELGAFRAYADLYPDNCLLLVDTVNTLKSGVPNAIRVFKELKKKGHEPMGIRLDSGDLAYLSIQAAKMLNEAGFDHTVIVLSNKLDEMVIWQILTQIRKEAPKCGLDPEKLIKRLSYGVGTGLITSKGDAALDGVYKLTAIEKNGKWTPAIKISETPAKTLNPGFKYVWRLYDQRDKAVVDLLSLSDKDPFRRDEIIIRHPVEVNTTRALKKSGISGCESMLQPVLRTGKRLSDTVSIEDMRKKRDRDLQRLDSGVKRLTNPHRYHISLTQELWDLKQEMIGRYAYE